MSLIYNGNEIRQEEGMLLFNAHPVKELYYKDVLVWKADPFMMSKRVVIENGTAEADFGVDLTSFSFIFFQPESGRASVAGKYTITTQKSGTKVVVTTAPATAKITGKIIVPGFYPFYAKDCGAAAKSENVWKCSLFANAAGSYASATDITFGDTEEASFAYDYQNNTGTCTVDGNVSAMTMHFYSLPPIAAGPDILGGAATVEGMQAINNIGAWGSIEGNVKSGYTVKCPGSGASARSIIWVYWLVDLTQYSTVTFKVYCSASGHPNGGNFRFYPLGTNNANNLKTIRGETSNTWTADISGLKGYALVGLEAESQWTNQFTYTWGVFQSITLS